MTQFTPRFKFPIPDFAVKPWHANLLTCFTRIDEVIFQAVLSSGVVAWATSTTFEAGQSAVDTLTGQFWTCLVDHTSGSTTFADDRDAFPLYWGLSTVAPENRGPWTTATAYKNTDYVTHDNGYYVCLVSHTSGTFSEDLANSFWSVLIDLGPTLALINESIDDIEEFNEVYLGAKASDPIVNNDGGPLISGAMYFNTATNVLKIYTEGVGWTAITTSAPTSATYLVRSADAGLSAERVVTDGSSPGQTVYDWSTAGQVKASIKVTVADRYLYSTAANTWAEAEISAFARSILDDSTAAAVRTTIGLGTISTLSFPGTTSTYLRGDGNFITFPTLGSVASINLPGNAGVVLRGDGVWTTYGTLATYSFPGGGTFLRADGNWATPTDTVGVNAADWNLFLSGSTVLTNTNNFGGIGSMIFGSCSIPDFPGNPVTMSAVGGTWRNMSDYYAGTSPIGSNYILAIRIA